jgi:hypothetical protein
MPVNNNLGWNSQQVLQDVLSDPNLVFCAPLNEQSGTFYDRCLATQATGTASGAVGYSRPIKTYSTGRYVIEASNQYFSQPSSAATVMGDIDFTIAIWANKLVDTAGGYPGVIAKNDGSGLEYEIYWDAGEHPTFYVRSYPTGATSATVGTPNALSLGSWHLIIAWHDSVNNTLNIQADNGTVGTAAWSSGVYAGTSEFWLGRQTNQNLTGYLGPAMVWKRVLTSAERAALYRGQGWGYSYSQMAYAQPTLVNGLTSWWDMTEASGNAVASVGANLTQVNSPTTSPGVILPDPYDAYGVHFDGAVGTYINFGNLSALNFDARSPFSLLVVGNEWASPASEWTLFSKCANNISGWKLDLLPGPAPAIFFFNSNTGSIFVNCQASTTVTNGTPFMLGSAWNGALAANTDIQLFLNGTECSYGTRSVTTTGAIAMANGWDVNIGRMASNGGYWPSDVGLVAVFNAQKTAADFRRWATLGGFR